MRKLFLILLLVFVLFFVDAYYIEPNILISKNETLYLPNWDKELDGLKIAVISDLHIGTKNIKLEKLEEIVKKVNAKNPDIVFILGDYDAVYIKKFYKPYEVSNVLNKLQSKYGVVSILGNHDYRPPNVVKNCLKNTNIILLENNNKYLYSKGKKIKITGLKDLWHFPNTEPKKVIGKIEEPTIILSHNPDLFPKIPQNVSLTLSGHTHGGEINFPFLGSPFVPSAYGQKYNKGYIIENGKHLYVSSGIATTSKFRLYNAPEILFFTIYSQKTPTKDTKIKSGFKKNWLPTYFLIEKKLKRNILDNKN